MRKKALITALILAVMCVAGCDTSKIAPTSKVIEAQQKAAAEAKAAEEAAEKAAEEEAREEAIAEAIASGEEIPEELQEEEIPTFRSAITGSEITYNWLDHRPLAVMLNNIKEGCPQSGIEEASIVYECPVEGRITRLMALFEKYEEIPKIGSIRSCRDYFVYLALEYDAIYAHFGQATIYVGDMLNSTAVDNISGAVSGIEVPAKNAFYRTNDRKAPHNVYISNEGIVEDIKEFGYRTTYRTGFQMKFKYCELDERVTWDGQPDATVLYPGGKTTDKANGFSKVGSRFEYNAADGKYYRFQYGDKHIDAETGNQLAYDNVVFQYANGIVRDSKDYLGFGLVGDNVDKVQVFTNGKMTEGTWKRTEIYEPAKYYDTNGEEIVVNPGKTWICLIWNDYADDVVIE